MIFRAGAISIGLKKYIDCSVSPNAYSLHLPIMATMLPVTKSTLPGRVFCTIFCRKNRFRSLPTNPLYKLNVSVNAQKMEVAHTIKLRWTEFQPDQANHFSQTPVAIAPVKRHGTWG